MSEMLPHPSPFSQQRRGIIYHEND